MIGAGIFLVPASIARDLSSGYTILAVWIAAGVISFCGALAYAELGAMFPASGGQYVYLREAFGPLAAFLAGWAFFLVIQSGSIAAVSVGGSIYLSYLLPGVPYVTMWAPVLVIGVLSWINYLGVRMGARVQLVFTVLKVSGLGLLITCTLAGRQPVGDASHVLGAASMMTIGGALLGAFNAYDGWHVIAFVAGEIKEPQRTLPRALALGVFTVMVIYVLANVAYLRILGLETVRASEQVAAASLDRVLGPAGATAITLTIVLSTIGAANGGILTAPRIYFAQARDRLFFWRMADIHPRYVTPHVSIAVQGVWAAMLALSGSYEALFSYVLFVSWAVHAATVLGLIVLRRKRPELPRPYRVWGYPLVPMLFFVFAVWLVLNTWIVRPWPSFTGAMLLAAGIPIFYVWRRSSYA